MRILVLKAALSRMNVMDALLGLFAAFLLMHLAGYGGALLLGRYVMLEFITVYPQNVKQGEPNPIVFLKGRHLGRLDRRMRVSIGGRNCPHAYVNSNSIRVQVPAGLALGRHTVTITDPAKKNPYVMSDALRVILPAVPNTAPVPAVPEMIERVVIKEKTVEVEVYRSPILLKARCTLQKLDPPVSDRSLKWLIKKKGGKNIRIISWSPQRDAVVAEVLLFGEKLVQGERTHYLFHGRPIRRGSPILIKAASLQGVVDSNPEPVPQEERGIQ